MNTLEGLPEDLIIVLIETVRKISKTSLVVLAHVNKIWYITQVG
jgi:hypothetical protein